MNKQMTENEIFRLGKRIGFDYSAAELTDLSAHIKKQLLSFDALNDVDTDGVDPTFDLDGKGRFKVERRGE